MSTLPQRNSDIYFSIFLFRIVARIYPAVPVSELEDDLSYMNEPASMAQSFYIKSDSSEPSLFSSQKVVRGNEGISNYSRKSDFISKPRTPDVTNANHPRSLNLKKV